jgi:hypothetical protein
MKNKKYTNQFTNDGMPFDLARALACHAKHAADSLLQKGFPCQGNGGSLENPTEGCRQVGLIFVQDTGKPVTSGTKDEKPTITTRMYNMLGTMELRGWMRCITYLDPAQFSKNRAMRWESANRPIAPLTAAVGAEIAVPNVPATLKTSKKAKLPKTGLGLGSAKARQSAGALI